MTDDKLNELLARVEQSEDARLLDKHTPEFRLLTEIVNRIQEIETRLEDNEPVLGRCIHGVDLDKDFCEHGCRV